MRAKAHNSNRSLSNSDDSAFCSGNDIGYLPESDSGSCFRRAGEIDYEGGSELSVSLSSGGESPNKTKQLFPQQQQSLMRRCESIRSIGAPSAFNQSIGKIPQQSSLVTQPPVKQSTKIDSKNFTLDRYEEQLQKQFMTREIDLKNQEVPSSRRGSNRKTQTAFQKYADKRKAKFQRQMGHRKHRNSRVKNNPNFRPLRRKPGFQEVPKILIEQSNKHIRNKAILSRFISTDRTSATAEAAGRGQQGWDDSDCMTASPPKFLHSTSQGREVSTYSQSQINKIEPRLIPNADPFEDRDNSSEDDEDDIIEKSKKEEVKKSPFVIYPDSFGRGSWDIMLFFCIIYQSVMLPMRISFEMKTTDFTFYLEVTIDIMFLLDIIVNFNTGFYKKNGTLVMSRFKLIKEYCSLWFWIDLVSSLPYTWILAWSEGVSVREVEADDQLQGALANTPQLLRLLKIAKLLKMLKLLRVVKVKKILMKFEQYIVTDQMNLMVTFFNFTIKIIVVAHYMGCFFFYFGMDELRSKNKGWLIDKDIFDTDFTTQYITSIYWAFTTMAAVGYGDIKPITKDERIYGMAAMIMSSGIFAYTVNSISTIVSSYNQAQTEYREKMMYVNQYMTKKDMPQELRMKVRRYLDYVFEAKKETKLDDSEVFRLLNESLTDKIQMYLRGRILCRIILFIGGFGLDFLSELTLYFTNFTYVADDFLFMEKDRAEFIYFIIQGKVAMIHKQTHTFVTDLSKDSYFGELGFLSGEPRCLSAMSRDFTEVFQIKKNDFDRICENYMEAITATRKIREALEDDNYLPLKTQCYLCQAPDHLALKCNKFYRWKGNLMRMYVLQMQKPSKIGRLLTSDNNESGGNDDPLGGDPLDNDNDDYANEKRQSFFVYADEIHENLQYPSMESQDEFEIKVNLIRQNVREGQKILDGNLISRILEDPVGARQEIEYEPVLQSIMNLDGMVGFQTLNVFQDKSVSTASRDGPGTVQHFQLTTASLKKKSETLLLEKVDKKDLDSDDSLEQRDVQSMIVKQDSSTQLPVENKELEGKSHATVLKFQKQSTISKTSNNQFSTNKLTNILEGNSLEEESDSGNGMKALVGEEASLQKKRSMKISSDFKRINSGQFGPLRLTHEPSFGEVSLGQKNVPISYPSFGRKVNFVQFVPQPTTQQAASRMTYARWRDDAEIGKDDRMSDFTAEEEEKPQQQQQETDSDFKTTPTPIERKMPEISLQRPSEIYNSTQKRPEEPARLSEGREPVPAEMLSNRPLGLIEEKKFNTWESSSQMSERLSQVSFKVKDIKENSETKKRKKQLRFVKSRTLESLSQEIKNPQVHSKRTAKDRRFSKLVPAGGGQLQKCTTQKAQFLKKPTGVQKAAHTKSIFYQREQQRDRSEDRGRSRYHDTERSRRALIAKAYLPQKQRKPKHSRQSGRDLSSNRRAIYESQIQTERLHHGRIAKTIGRNTPSKQTNQLREESPPLPMRPERNSLKSYSKSREAGSSQYSVGGLKIFTHSAKNEGFGMNKPPALELQQQRSDHFNITNIMPPVNEHSNNEGCDIIIDF